MLDRTACTEDRRTVDYALSSFPSGHSTAAFAGFIFLFLYLNAKLKVWSDYRPSCWKLVVTYLPILGAIIIAGTVTTDHSHHWYDVVAGAVLGTLMAFSTFRMSYASVWDFRFDHIPLARRVPFKYCIDPTSTTYHGFYDAMWTREAGWGSQGAKSWSGAPFDSAGSELASSNGIHFENSSKPPVGSAEHMA